MLPPVCTGPHGQEAFEAADAHKAPGQRTCCAAGTVADPGTVEQGGGGAWEPYDQRQSPEETVARVELWA